MTFVYFINTYWNGLPRQPRTLRDTPSQIYRQKSRAILATQRAQTWEDHPLHRVAFLNEIRKCRREEEANGRGTGNHAGSSCASVWRYWQQARLQITPSCNHYIIPSVGSANFLHTRKRLSTAVYRR